MSRPRQQVRPQRKANVRGGPHSGPSTDAPDAQRLQKVLAAAGIGSRRQCEELIETGRVEVDRQVVTQLGTKVDPRSQEIRVDGTPLKRPRLHYYAVHKPAGVVSTNRDPAGRPRVIDMIPTDHRLFTVGRLDLHSEGLMLVTNDGELANLLAHPRYGVEKTYHALVVGEPEPDVLVKLRQGVHLAEGFAHVARVSVKSKHKGSTLLEMVLDEGRNRELRRLLARVGHKVLRLKRIALGPLRLAELPVGEFRPLRSDEVRELRQTAVDTRKRRRSQKPKPLAAAGQQPRSSPAKVVEPDESALQAEETLIFSGQPTGALPSDGPDRGSRPGQRPRRKHRPSAAQMSRQRAARPLQKRVAAVAGQGRAVAREIRPESGRGRPLRAKRAGRGRPR